jgi:hypothetical protein
MPEYPVFFTASTTPQPANGIVGKAAPAILGYNPQHYHRYSREINHHNEGGKVPLR